MQNLKNSLFLLFFGFLISACQSKPTFRFESFRDANEDLHIIRVNSDRVQQKCLFMNAEGDNNWRHQYFMYVLNDKSEVLEIMESTHIDGDSCRSQFDAIENMLKAAGQVKVCVRNEVKMKSLSGAQKELVSFGPLGQHSVTQDGLTFDTICNSKKCVGDNSAWVKTCPGFPKQYIIQHDIVAVNCE
jgi:hypothetical protein